MGLLTWLLGADPTDKWPTQNLPAPDYDIDHHRLCGIRLGAGVQAFAKLGRAEDRPRARKGRLIYYSRGLEANIEEGHVMDLALHFDSAWGEPGANPKPYPGRIGVAGHEVRWTGRTTEAEITAALGPPDKRDDNEDEILLTYTRGTFTYDVDLSPAGLLRAIMVTAEEKVT